MKGIGLLIALLVVTLGYTQAPDTLWTRTYGGPQYDWAQSIQLTSTGGYIFTGGTGTYYFFDIWLTATDGTGNTLWTKFYGYSGWDEAWCIQKTFDGGYILAGSRTVSVWRDALLIKTDENGDTLWTRSYSGPDDDEALWIQETPDTGYLVYAMTKVGGTPSVWLLKTDINGDTLWTKTYGGFRPSPGQKDLLIQGNGYMIPCNHLENYWDFDYALIKTDSLGNALWAKSYGGPGHDYIFECTHTNDGGYIAVGQINDDALIVKFDINGDTLWTNTFGGLGYDGLYSVNQVYDEGYIMAGYTTSFGAGDSDVWLIRTDSNGNMMWQHTWGGAQADECHDIQVCPDSSYILAGITSSYGNSAQAWLIKTGPDVGIEEYEIIRPTEKHEHLCTTIFRGPLQLPEGKKCKVFDITGRIVEPDRIQPGIYFIEIDGVVAQKVVKVR